MLRNACKNAKILDKIRGTETTDSIGAAVPLHQGSSMGAGVYLSMYYMVSDNIYGYICAPFQAHFEAICSLSAATDLFF